MAELIKVTVYTDGACSGNPGPGGYAALMVCGKHECVVRGYSPRTTNNRMELQAVIAAAKTLKKPCYIQVITDSQYVCNTISTAETREQNGWKSKTGAKYQNIDLLSDFLTTKKQSNHTFEFIYKERSSTEGNKLCDKYAKEQIELHKGEENAFQEVLK